LFIGAGSSFVGSQHATNYALQINHQKYFNYTSSLESALNEMKWYDWDFIDVKYFHEEGESREILLVIW